MSGVASAILSGLNRETLESLNLVDAIAHPGENGRARENILRAFIRELLPTAYEASTGFVFDSLGAISRQIDLVVYRRDYAPVFHIGGIDHFLVEAVVAVFEVKASITTRATLIEALENLRSVKSLDRTGAGRNYVLHGNQQGPLVDPNKYEHQIFGAILTEHSLSRPTLVKVVQAYLATHPVREWPNGYFDVRRLSALYAYHEDGQALRTTDPTLATELFVSDAKQPPLLDLASNLLDLLRVAELIDFSPDAYFPDDASGRAFPLTTEPTTPSTTA